MRLNVLKNNRGFNWLVPDHDYPIRKYKLIQNLNYLRVLTTSLRIFT